MEVIRKAGTVRSFMFLIAALLPAVAYGNMPDVTEVMVTDVTTRSFSVIWTSSEASYPSLNVYDDVNGTVPTSDAVITLQPVESDNNDIGIVAENNGVLKVRVTGLEPDTTYYFQTVTTSKSFLDDVTFYPANPLFPGVTTESSVMRTKMCGEADVPFTNDLITVECYLPESSTPAEGTLLVAEVEGCHYPVSRFVGDGVPVPEAYIDLNNLFSLQSYTTKPVYGGERLTLTRLMGIHGVETSEYYVPINEQLAQMKFPLLIPPCLGDFYRDGDVDGSDLAVFATDFGRTDCDTGEEREGDFDHDNDVDGSDLAVFAADFGRTDCPD
jgi:hypothetical protein